MADLITERIQLRERQRVLRRDFDKSTDGETLLNSIRSTNPVRPEPCDLICPLVEGVGFEPTVPSGHWILSPAQSANSAIPPSELGLGAGNSPVPV